MYYVIQPFHLYVLLFISTGFLAEPTHTITSPSSLCSNQLSHNNPFLSTPSRLVHHWDTNNDSDTDSQWTFVPRGLNRSSPMPGTEERVGVSKGLRYILSKASLAKVTLCTIATNSLISSLISSVLSFGVAQWTSRSHGYYTFETNDYMTRIEHAYERITNDKARMEWEEQSVSVDSAAFLKSYYLVFFGGLICK
jgi:hypothetical protein